MQTGPPTRTRTLIQIVGDVDNAHAAVVAVHADNAVCPLDNANALIAGHVNALVSSAKYCFKNRSISLQRTSSI